MRSLWPWRAACSSRSRTKGFNSERGFFIFSILLKIPFINLALAIPPSNHLPSLPSRFNHFKIRKVKGCKESRILLFETPLSLYQTCLSPLPNTSNVLTEQELPIFALLCFFKKLLSNIYYCVAAPRCGKERKKKTPPLTLCFGMNLS